MSSSSPRASAQRDTVFPAALNALFRHDSKPNILTSRRRAVRIRVWAISAAFRRRSGWLRRRLGFCSANWGRGRKGGWNFCPPCSPLRPKKRSNSVEIIAELLTCHAGGRGFEPRRSRHEFKHLAFRVRFPWTSLAGILRLFVSRPFFSTRGFGGNRPRPCLGVRRHIEGTFKAALLWSNSWSYSLCRTERPAMSAY
jgi:hypothetical protein